MASKLIKHLKYCIANDPSLSVLGHQWGFDEKLIPKALQNIGSLYSDYSLHDESHSKQILVNIERILGEERIKLLTATDTWLLLEAAYWHDIGMVVTRDQFTNACNDENFWLFLEEIKCDENHYLNDLCQDFDLTKNQWNIQTKLPFTLVQNFKSLFSEWFRKKHAQLSSDIVRSPWEKANLSSPRTELIPERLFLLLGKVCELHGATFDDLISDKIPYKEVGIGTEDCHPRYVASLLRLGDLLDIDDNRFCPVMMKISGGTRTYFSQVHENKHRAIRHFRLDPELIEIECECSSEDLELGIDSYLEATNWFKWLEDELKNQMTHWTKIAPNKTLGLLPTLGRVNVRFTDKNYFIPKHSRPEFGIDIDRAMNILQDLYTDQFVCIRELLQNSVDSTYIRFFLENSDKNSNLESFEQVTAGLKNYRIRIFISEISDGDNLKLKLKIQDNGAGISLNDFNHMMKIGGSKNNQDKKKIVKKMPKILQPSGTFGIGFQSVFLLSNKVSFLTKSYISDEKLQVEMYNPLGNRQGLCTFKSVEKRIDYGTTLNVELNFDETQIEDNKRLSNNNSFNDQAISDRFIFDSNSIIKANIIRKINDFKKYSLVPIEVESEGISGGMNDIGKDLDEVDNLQWKTISYNGEVYRYSIMPCYQNSSKKLLFKGQVVAAPTARDEGGQGIQSYFNLSSISIYLDFLSHDAFEWLTAQRNKVRDNKFDDFNSITKYIVDFECKNNDSVKNAYALSIIGNIDLFTRDIHNKDIDNIWKDDLEFKSILTSNGINVYNKDYLDASIDGVFFGTSNTPPIPPPEQHVIINTGNGSNFERSIITAINNQSLFFENLGYSFSYNVEQKSYTYNYSKEHKFSIDSDYLASIFYCGHKQSGTRPLIAYSDDFEKFSKLFIDIEKIPRHLLCGMNIVTSKMAISPFVFFQKRTPNGGVQNRYELHLLEQFCEKLIDNKLIIDIKSDELIKLYDDFSKLVVNKINSSNLEKLKNIFDS